ncbi:hypothetical protein CR513_57733, partial [Mucuna pruriens]
MNEMPNRQVSRNKADLTFSSPNQADRISHIFPQSPAQEKEEESNHIMTHLGLRKACLALEKIMVSMIRMKKEPYGDSIGVFGHNFPRFLKPLLWNTPNQLSDDKVNL